MTSAISEQKSEIEPSCSENETFNSPLRPLGREKHYPTFSSGWFASWRWYRQQRQRRCLKSKCSKKIIKILKANIESTADNNSTDNNKTNQPIGSQGQILISMEAIGFHWKLLLSSMWIQNKKKFEFPFPFFPLIFTSNQGIEEHTVISRKKSAIEISTPLFSLLKSNLYEKCSAQIL